MLEFVVTSPHCVEFREYSEPRLKPGEVRVETMITGLKHGTELALYEGKTPLLSKQFDQEYRLFLEKSDYHLYPINLGSWGVGRIIELGEEVQNFALNDLVHGPMLHKPTNVLRPPRLYPLGDLTPEIAIFTDPAIFALTAVQDAQIKVGDHIVIFGMGALGLLAIQFARMNGAATIIAVDIVPSRLELARQFGADFAIDASIGDVALQIKHLTDKKGVDTAIEISGSLVALQHAIRSVQPCGVVVAASYYKGQMPFEFGAEWHHNRLTMISSMPAWGMPHRHAPLWDLGRIERTIINLMQKNRLITAPMLNRVFSYPSASEAYSLLAAQPDQFIKTAFIYEETRPSRNGS